MKSVMRIMVLTKYPGRRLGQIVSFGKFTVWWLNKMQCIDVSALNGVSHGRNMRAFVVQAAWGYWI
jgi:hypothetical protein